MRVRVSLAARRDTAAESHVPRPSSDLPSLGGQQREYHWSPSQTFFLIVAIACLGLFSYAYLERVLYQTYESWSFDRAADRSASVAGSHQDVTPIGHIAHAPLESIPPSESPFSTSIIGRLSVPRLHLTAMVREGIDGNTLQLAVGHIPSTALPGQAGNVGVAGHRDTFFRGLKDLRTGDEIQFATPRGNFSYEVESLMVVEPNNIGVLAASGGNVLTMVTCYPFSYIGNAPKRFIVRARQVLPQPESPSTVEDAAKPAAGKEPDGAEVISSPLMFGITTSVNNSATGDWSYSFIAVSASSARRTAYPSTSSKSFTNVRIAQSSSTTNIVWLDLPGCISRCLLTRLASNPP